MKKTILIFMALFLTACNSPLTNIQVDQDKDTKIPIIKISLEEKKKSTLTLTTPENKAIDIQGKIPITFLWDKPLFPLQRANIWQEKLKKEITMTPEIQGSWSVLGTSGLIFEPKENWPMSTQVNITLPEKLVGNEVKHMFQTPRLKLIQTGSQDLINRKPVKLHFNQDIDIQSVVSNLNIEPNFEFDLRYGQKEKYGNEEKSKVLITDKTILEIIPKKDWPTDSHFSFTVKKGTKASVGNLVSDKDIQGSIQTITNFQVNNSYPPKNAYQSASINFSHNVKSKDFAKHLSIYPKPTDDQWNQYTQQWLENDYDTSYFDIPAIGKNWDPTESYTITVDGDLMDIYGRKLGKEFKMTFTALFNDQIKSLYFPAYNTVFPSTMDPKFVMYYTGKERTIRIKLLQNIPNKKAQSIEVNLDESTTKKSIFNIELLKDFSEIFENGKLEPGQYEIKIFESENQRAQQSTTFFITDFAVGIKDYADDRYEVFASSFEGRPINAKNTTIKTWDFASSGLAFVFKDQSLPTVIEDSNADFTLVYLENGKLGIGSTSFNKKMSPYDAKVSFNPWNYQTNITATALTDRPLYKPGDTLYFKSIFRDLENFGKVTPLLPVDPQKKQPYTLKIMDPFWEEIYKKEGIALGGALDGQWEIPADSPLGTYQIQIEFGDKLSRENNISIPFHIQKYRKPKFLIQSKFNTERAIYKEKIKNEVSAKYAFGGALAYKKIQYTISLFGNEKNCWWYCEKKDRVLLSGNGILDKDGAFSIPIDLDFKRENPDILWNTLTTNLNIEASIDETSSREISIPFYESNQIINLDYGKYFYPKESKITQTGMLTDLDKNPIAKKVKVKLLLERWVRNDRKGIDGDFYGEWKRDNEMLWEKEIKSDKKGKFEIDFIGPKKSGNYFLQFTSTDKKGRTTTQQKSFWISGNDFESIRTNDQNRILQIFNDKKEYQVGETAEVFFPITNFDIDKSTTRATIERGEVLQELPINFDNNTISFKIEDWMSPNVFVSILLTGKNEKGHHDVRWGSSNIIVKNPKRNLDITVTPQKETYQPGEEIQLKIKTSVQGKPVPASVTVAVVDQTLLALKSRSSLNLWQKFLAQVPLGVSTSHTFANFISKDEMEEILAETEAIMSKMAMDLGGGGGKGGDFRPRGNFRDTATFQAQIKTNKDGEAIVKFIAPDNLTTWNIWAIGDTNDNAFGEVESETQVTIPMLISEILPNAFQSGDEINIGLLVRRNNTNKKSAKVKVKLNLPKTMTSKTLEKEIVVEEEGYVFFPVKVSDWDFNTYTSDNIEATIGFEISSDDGFSDAAEFKRKIFPPKISLSVADFLRIENKKTINILPDFVNAITSKLSIKVSPSIVTKLETLVDIARKMNYGCTEQQMSFYTGILLQKELDTLLGKETPDIDINLLKKSRDYIESTFVNNGFGFWRQSENPSVWVTANVLENEQLWGDYNVSFDAGKIDQIKNYLHREILKTCAEKNWNCMSDTTRNYAAAVIAERQILTTADLDFLTEHAKSIEAKIWWIRASRIVQKYGIRLSPASQKFETEAWAEINKHIKARDRYIFWEESTRSFYSQNERLSAIILEEMIEADRNKELQHKAARYLTETKSKNLSGNSSIRILKALKKYAKENEVSNIGSKFIVNNNIDQEIVSGELEKINSTVISETILHDKKFDGITLETKNDKPFYADVELHEVLPVQKILPVSKGFFLEREIYSTTDTKFKTPLTQLKQGENYVVRLRIVNNASHRQIALIDHVPAGVEFINFEFNNVDKTLKTIVQDDQCFGWCRPKFDHQEFHETEARFFTDYLSPGIHEVKYLIRARMTGNFEVMPAKIEEMYFPEVFAITKGEKVMIVK